MDEEEIRLYLHSALETAFPDLNLYYRPPGNLKLEYPCIVYEPKSPEPAYSNNSAYVIGTRFQLTFLSTLPGYSDVRNIYSVPGIIVGNTQVYVSSNVVHDVFTIFVHSIT